MAQDHGSQAYDLSLFEPREATVVEIRPNKKLEQARRKKNAVQSMLNMVSMVAVAVIAIAVMCMMIAGRVQLTEIQGDIKATEKRLTELESERVRLSDELARKSSAQSIEDYARDVLGMQKVDPSQITYVQVEPGSKAEVAEEEPPGILEKIGAALSNFFAQVAYLFD